MFHFAIPLFLALAPPAGAATVDEAAQLLSRYPMGQVPSEPQILEAIHTISESGNVDDVPVLESLALHESGPVRVAAVEGLGSLTFRQRIVFRRAFAGQAPSRSEVDQWLADHDHLLHRANGDPLGPIERTSVAYTTLVLTPEVPTPVPSTVRLHQLAEQREDAADGPGALRLYAEAARRGDPTAAMRIEEYGVDAERLILGILCTPDRGVPLSNEETTLETLVSTGSTTTVRVMMERSTRGAPLERAIALDALSRMIGSGRLSTTNALAARRSLLAATRWDPEMDVRTLARAALEELAPR